LRPPLADIAEEPGDWIPGDGMLERVPLDGLVVFAYGRSLSVENIRLSSERVADAVEAVRAVARAREIDGITWWLGGNTQPAGLEELVRTHGLVPDPVGPDLTTVTIERRPGGGPSIEVLPVLDESDYRRALELDWEVFAVPEAERARRRAGVGEHWRTVQEQGMTALHVAWLDGTPVAMARTVYTPHGGLMLGGATLPDARGRGAYTSLVHARWNEAVARGTPALGTAAGALSAPILIRLGFEVQGHVRLLLDRVQAS
jgi:hypothetical protein